MKIAIPQWQNRVSPLLDEAGTFTIVDISGGRERNRSEISLFLVEPFERIKFLLQLGVHTVICGAISQTLGNVFDSSDIRVISHICGTVDEVVEAFLRGRLHEPRFLQPGYRKREDDGEESHDHE